MTITSSPDNLAAVKGIGRDYERRLNEAGCFTWVHLAALGPDELQRITQAPDGSNCGSWPEEARNLARKNQRSDVEYQGPVPDKLIEIPGIGESIQQRLYEQGIYTFKQLADASLEQLEDMVPIAKRSIDADLNLWIKEATERKNQK